jgi:hypothetical protein
MRILRATVALVFAGAVSLPLFAETKSVKGEVVDQACYTKDKTNKGPDHADCGLSCAKKGAPLAIVTSAGDVYQITGSYTQNKNEKLIEHFGKTIEATGEVTEKDGKKMIDVASIKQAA